MDKKCLITAKNSILTSFLVHAAPKSKLNYTTPYLSPTICGFQFIFCGKKFHFPTLVRVSSDDILKLLGSLFSVHLLVHFLMLKIRNQWLKREKRKGLKKEKRSFRIFFELAQQAVP